jgi:hypothetical protein
MAAEAGAVVEVKVAEAGVVVEAKAAEAEGTEEEEDAIAFPPRPAAILVVAVVRPLIAPPPRPAVIFVAVVVQPLYNIMWTVKVYFDRRSLAR